MFISRWIIQGLVISRHSTILLLGIIAAGFALRFHGLSDESFWRDEVRTVVVSQWSIPELIYNRLQRGHSPLYFLFMHAWIRLGGTGELWVRLPSAVLGAASIPFVFLIGRTLFGTVAGVAASFFFSIHTLQIQYAQEARMYSLAVFLGLLSTLLLLRVFESRRTLWWAGYLSCSVLSLWISATAVFVLLCHVIWAMLYLDVDSSKRKPFLGALAWITMFSVPLWMAVAAYSRGHGTILQKNPFSPPWESWIRNLGGFFSIRHLTVFGERLWYPGGLAWVVCLLILGILIWDVWRCRRDRALLGVWLWLFVPMGIGAVASFVIQWPVRYLLFSACCWIILLGRFCILGRWRWMRLILLAALVGLNLIDLACYYAFPDKLPWKEVGAYASSQGRVGEPMYVYPDSNTLELGHYYRGGEVVPLGVHSMFEDLGKMVDRPGWVVFAPANRYASDANGSLWQHLIERSFRKVVWRSFGPIRIYRYAGNNRTQETVRSDR